MGIGTARLWVAGFVCARVAVVTVFRLAGAQTTAGAGVVVGTSIVVVASRGQRAELALSTVAVAVAGCTGIAIITGLGLASRARAIDAEITNGASGAIVARALTFLVGTALVGLAEVNGAGVAIVTTNGLAEA